jgi:thermostable 8-oxoguanine DNA glycosylase
MRIRIKTIDDIDSSTYSSEEFDYKLRLTPKLDKSNEIEFDQNLLSEIVLWKTNRYVSAEDLPLDLLNSSKIKEKQLDESFTRELLSHLLSKTVKGIRLPMASTILRFRNPFVYQIIDQRAYRFANLGETLKLPTKIEDQIDLYINYLKRIREIAESRNIAFENMDRLLYILDKEENKKVKLNGYD